MIQYLKNDAGSIYAAVLLHLLTGKKLKPLNDGGELSPIAVFEEIQAKIKDLKVKAVSDEKAKAELDKVDNRLIRLCRGQVPYILWFVDFTKGWENGNKEAVQLYVVSKFQNLLTKDGAWSPELTELFNTMVNRDEVARVIKEAVFLKDSTGGIVTESDALNELAAKNKEIAAFDAKIAVLDEQIDEGTKLAKELTESILEKDARILELENAAKERDNKIGNLTAELDAKEKSAAEATITAKKAFDAEVSVLEKQIADAESAANAFEAKVKTLTAEVKKLKAAKA